MKKLLCLSALALGWSGSALAADGSSGCGVGWYIFKDKSLLSSSLRQITNSALPNTFSMTFGTSNCAKHSIVHNDKKGLHFVEANQSALEMELAAGEGELLEGLAQTFGCPTQSLPAFSFTLRSAYTELMPEEQMSSRALYQRISETLRDNPSLRTQCSQLAAREDIG